MRRGEGACQLVATFKPAEPGDKKLFLEANLGDELFIILNKTVTVLEAKEKANINATVPKDLASIIPVGIPQDIEFLFSNESNAPAEGIGIEIKVTEEG